MGSFSSFVKLLIRLLPFYVILPAMAQEATADTMKRIEILSASRLRQITTDSGTILNALAGSAVIRHETTVMSGDSIVFDPDSGWAEVFGHVHINNSDTVQTDAGYIRYIGHQKKAFLREQVKFADKEGILFAEEVTYDIGGGWATYEGGGRVENGNTVLTSRSALLYTNTHDVYFRDRVQLTDPKYDIASDSMLYNTVSKTATFIAPTLIRGKDGSVIETRSGTYNLLNGKASFYDRTAYKDKTGSLSGNRIEYEEKTGLVIIRDNGRVIDSASRLVMTGNLIRINKKKQTFLATQKPVLIFYEGKDSTYIAADTLFSALFKDPEKRPSKKQSKKDTAAAVSSTSVSDSARYFQAYHHVRIFNDSMQAVSDSLYYSDLDSTFRMFNDPVCWSKNTQISGDTVLLRTARRKPQLIDVIENSLVVSKTTEGFFNQVGGRLLKGYFKDGNIDYARMKGSPAEAVYFAQDKDSAYIGMNRSRSDVIDLYFSNREAEKVKFINNVDGTMYPMKEIPEDRKFLNDFRWQESRRPRSRLDLFQ